MVLALYLQGLIPVISSERQGFVATLSELVDRGKNTLVNHAKSSQACL